MSDSPTQNAEITLTFTAPELAQIEAFAALHGVSIATFVQRAALDAAHISERKNTAAPDALWLTEIQSAPTEPQPSPGLFAPLAAPQEQKDVSTSPTTATAPGAVATSLKRGVAGEPSQLAKGRGPVWEIRRALGHQRVHGLGWTREQLAFVLKLSVVGVRKMEHEGTAPVKSLESRKALLALAKTLENPTPEICAYIEREAAIDS